VIHLFSPAFDRMAIIQLQPVARTSSAPPMNHRRAPLPQPPISTPKPPSFFNQMVVNIAAQTKTIAKLSASRLSAFSAVELDK